jgi:RimJ/RimL family protein N-acetyltransferase
VKTDAVVPDAIDLADGLQLRQFTVDDAEGVADAVRDSLEELRMWLPWAGVESTKVDFQRDRLRKLPQIAARGEEWQYGLFAEGDPRVLGSFGLMTRRGPGTMEIGYWVHTAAAGRGYCTRAVRALTPVALAMPNVHRVLIFCDEANVKSAAIPRKLGYTLLRTDNHAIEAAGETGRMMCWGFERSS